MPAANSNSVEEVKAQLLSELYDLRVRPLKERKKKWQALLGKQCLYINKNIYIYIK